MESAWAFGSILAVSLLSLLGVVTLVRRNMMSHRVVMFLVAMAAGTLLGDAFLHLLPEAVAVSGFGPNVGWAILAGFLVMFGLEAILHNRHNHSELAEAAHGHGEKVQPFGWMNLTTDAFHNFLDGIVIAAAYLVDVHVGIATTIAVAMHEIPQELGDFAVLVRSGMSPKKALLFNAGSAMFAFAGGLLVFLLPSASAVEAWGLPLIAGAFIYIAAADLIPELHHHGGKDVWRIVIGLILGLLLMHGLLSLEVGGDAHAGHSHA